MEQIIIVGHIVAAFAIVALILLQQGRGADMGASFGSGSSQTVFGPAGSGNMLTKATAALAAIFFATSFGLAVVAKDKAASSRAVDIDIPVVADGVLEAAPVSAVEAEAAADDAPEVTPLSEEIPEIESGAAVDTAEDIPE